jgi:hypothetical protein
MIRHSIPENWVSLQEEHPNPIRIFHLSEDGAEYQRTVCPGQYTKVRLWWKPWKVYRCIEFPEGFDLNYAVAYTDPGFIGQDGVPFTEEQSIQVFADMLKTIWDDAATWYAPAGPLRGLVMGV